MTTRGELDRDSVRIDGDERRIYYDDDTEWMSLSVSTITGVRDNPEKEAILDNWRQSYDGSDADSYPHHEEQKVYKQLRGTLGHYAILSELGDVPKGSEEREAERILKQWATERPSKNQDNVTHRGDDHAYEGEQAWSKCMRDLSWVTSEFYDHCDEWGITPASTIACEQYVHVEDPPYSGQFDLLYEHDEHGPTLCDLKLASGIRYDYKLQIAAYRHAILESTELVDSIPRVQIIRLHPDSETVEVQTNKDWDQSLTELTAEFLSLAEEADDRWLQQITFAELQQRIED